MIKYKAQIDLTNKNNSHTVAIDFVIAHAAGRRLKILEVGCSTGYFGEALMEMGHEVWGVEVEPEPAKQAEEVLPKVFLGTIEDFIEAHAEVRFDVITFGDVLEHLVDPESVLKLCSSILTADGMVVASVPNVTHLGVRAMLMEGRWDYCELGLLDRTHLRFFSKKTTVELFHQAGYTVERLKSIKLPVQTVNDICQLNLRRSSIENIASLAGDPYGNDFQYLVAARPGTTAAVEAQGTDFLKLDGKNILVLVDDEESSICQIRLIKPLAMLADRFEVGIEFLPIGDFEWPRLDTADIVVVQRGVTSFIEAIVEQAQAMGKRVVYEVDDLITEIPDFLPHHQEYLGRARGTIVSLMKSADVISASTRHLAKELGAYSENIVVTPNYFSPFEPGRECTHSDVPPSEVTLLLASSDTVKVDMVTGPILELQKSLGVKVIAMGPVDAKLKAGGIKTIDVPNLGYDRFIEYISSLENTIGVIPLDDSVFSRCKSAIKLFDYTKCGIPVVCSNVLPYAEVVEDGQAGYLADNTDEAWASAVRGLIFDADLRQSVSRRAREVIGETWNIDGNISAWHRLLTDLAGSDQGWADAIGRSSTPRPRFIYLARKLRRNLLVWSSWKKLAKSLAGDGVKNTLKKIRMN